MYDPLMRVLTVLEILQARDQVTGKELAERLEVDLRTVQRYITRLQDLCIPVESVRGVGGHYRLKPGFRLPPLMLTDEEAFALSLGLRALRNLGLTAFAPATEGAAAKLGRVLPASLCESVKGIEEAVAVDPGPWVVPIEAESLITVANCIRTRRRLSFGYTSHQKSASERELDPYAVSHVDGRWYVVGHCLLRNEMRTFRLDRMQQMNATETAFQPPEHFNVAEYLSKHMPFVETKYDVDIWVGMPIGKARQWLGPTRVVIEAEGDGTRLRCRRDNLDMLAAMLLAIGAEVKVRSPVEMRSTFEELARRAAAVSVNIP